VALLSGKIQTLANATREQRREYKSKFVDMDVEFGRLKERMETLNMILDDMQVPSLPVQVPSLPAKGSGANPTTSELTTTMPAS
jgi:hypothetical protein